MNIDEYMANRVQVLERQVDILTEQLEKEKQNKTITFMLVDESFKFDDQCSRDYEVKIKDKKLTIKMSKLSLKKLPEKIMKNRVYIRKRCGIHPYTEEQYNAELEELKKIYKKEKQIRKL